MMALCLAGETVSPLLLIVINILIPMRNHRKDACWISLIMKGMGLLLIMIILSGCSVLGFLWGSQSDAKARPNDITISVHDIYRINKGNYVEIHRVKGPILKGYFLSTEKVGLESIVLISQNKEDRILKIRTSEIYQIVVSADTKTAKWVFAAIGAVFDAVLIGFLFFY